MGAAHVRIRPRPSFVDPWAVDLYDGRGRWQGTVLCPDKRAAQRNAARLRRAIRKGSKR